MRRRTNKVGAVLIVLVSVVGLTCAVSESATWEWIQTEPALQRTVAREQAGGHSDVTHLGEGTGGRLPRSVAPSRGNSGNEIVREAGQGAGQRCLAQEEEPEIKYFYLNQNPEEVKILTSDNPTQRLVSEVFRILGSEILGFPISLEVNTNPTSILDPDTQFANISSCLTKFCTDLDEQTSRADNRIPAGMMSLAVMLPPSYHVDTWGLVDLGQLGPSSRLGWFIPSRTAATSPPIWDHWRTFTNRELAVKFTPTPAQLSYIRARLTDAAGRFFCVEDYCENGFAMTPACPDVEEDSCALLITDYPVQSSLFNTSLILRQMAGSKMAVGMVFVGNYLEEILDFMEQSTQEEGNSYLLLSPHPSTYTTRHQYTQVKFPDCRDPLLMREETDLSCMYSPHRLSKVVWKQVQNGAPALYTFLESFAFTYREFVDLLGLYNKLSADNSVSLAEVACQWLQHETELTIQGEVEMTNWYRKWSSKLAKKQPLYIGGIFPISGVKYVAPELAPVALMAVKDINEHEAILPKHDIILDILDGQCEPDVVMKRFIDIVKTKNVARFRSTAGLLGPACSDTVEPIAGVSKHFRTVVITYSAEGSISNENSKDYPYFFRTIAENKQYKYAYMETLKKLKWGKVAALTQDGQKYSDYISEMQDEFQKNEITFVMNRKFPKETTDLSMYLNDLKERGARIIIGDFYVNSARHVMCQAYREGMTQEQGYVWFLPGWYRENWYDIDRIRQIREEEWRERFGSGNSSAANNYTDLNLEEGEDLMSNEPYAEMSGMGGKEEPKHGDLPDCTTEQMMSALNGHLSLGHSNYADDDALMQTNRTVGEWKARVKLRLDGFMEKYRNQSRIFKNRKKDLEQRFHYSSDGEPNKYSGYVYDAVWLYAIALDTLIRQNKSYVQNLHSDRTVEEFVRIIKNVDFNGVTGRINFFGRNSRLSQIRIRQWYRSIEVEEGGNSTTVVYTHEIGVYEPNYNPGNRTDSGKFKGRMISWNEGKLRWQTADRSKPPDDNKECGVLSSFATSLNLECQNAIIVAFIIGFCLVLFLICMVFLTFKRRYEMKMRAQEDRMRALGLLEPMSALALDEWEIPRDRVVINRKLGEGAFGTVCGGECFFDEKGWVAVAVKTLKVGSTHEVKLDFLSEAEMMKRFDHKNIVKLLGVCTRNEPVYTVMEYMLYGDLKTYLLARRHLVNERNREELDEVSNRRLTSMAHDIVKGLAYLADLKYVHRDIACRNCLVNASRTVKLADFGMTRAMFESDYYRFSRKGMLPVRWMSPESLADGLFTPMSDVWSYGVLLYEIITFGSFPFQGLSNNQVLEHVKAGNTLTIPSGIKPQLESLLRACFNITPTKRPTAQEIVELLGNNPRLVSPCIDVPLASVQIERTDSLELIPSVRNPLSTRKNSSNPRRSRDHSIAMSQLTGSSSNQSNQQHQLIIAGSREDMGYGSGAYSPMQAAPAHHITNGNGVRHESLRLREPLLKEPEHPSSYVPPGYILLDHSKNTADFSDYMPNRVASV